MKLRHQKEHRAITSDNTIHIDSLRRFVMAMTVLNIVWEFAHMPLYTLWDSGTWAEIVFAGSALHRGRSADRYECVDHLFIALRRELAQLIKGINKDCTADDRNRCALHHIQRVVEHRCSSILGIC